MIEFDKCHSSLRDALQIDILLLKSRKIFNLEIRVTYFSRYAIREKWYLASYKHISQWKWPKHLFIAFKAHIRYINESQQQPENL